jgi:hypothetical protein
MTDPKLDAKRRYWKQLQQRRRELDLEQQSNHDAFQRAMSHEKPITLIDPDPFGPLPWYDPNARG